MAHPARGQGHRSTCRSGLCGGGPNGRTDADRVTGWRVGRDLTVPDRVTRRRFSRRFWPRPGQGRRTVRGRESTARVAPRGGAPTHVDDRPTYGLSEAATVIPGSGTLENQSQGIGGELGGCSRCVAQRAFGRPIQKMLRWRPLTARGPLSGVRPHTQVRRVYEGKGKRKAKK